MDEICPHLILGAKLRGFGVIFYSTYVDDMKT